jgi:REP element-mobilizing transposase RayT
MAPPQSQVQRGGMSRQRRLYLPNAGFHITARTQNGAQYFTPAIRTNIADDIADAVPSFGHTLLACVVMPNHFHIVLKQGHSPLGWLMQRIMQRAVVHVRRVHEGEGHVFGRPYWSCVCTNPAYLRRAIVYTHMNPVKAGLCEAAADYAWSTHQAYLSLENTGSFRNSDLREGLVLFADTSLEFSEQRRSYMRFIDFCILQRANRIPGDWLLPEGPERIQIPSASHGDTYWAAKYSAFAETTSFTRVNIDVERPASAMLSRIAPDVTLKMIRFAGRSRTAGKIRQQLIGALLVYGCRTTAIARFLLVSPSLVSKVGREMRVSAIRTP